MGWWNRLKDIPRSARLAALIDRPIVATLLEQAWRHHGVLAVEEQTALLSSGVSVLAFEGKRASAFLGLRIREQLPNDSECWVEAALVALAGGVLPGPSLGLLLSTALPALSAVGVTGVVALTSYEWLQDALAEAGFDVVDQVITYTRSNHLPMPSAPGVAQLRRAGPLDTDTVLEINSAAFSPLWRYDTATMLNWLLTAEHASMATVAGRPAGFALTSGALNHGYDQLIRLAIHPEWQGQGVGRQLVVDTIAYSMKSGSPGVALNTQATNNVSRHLYEALGFRSVGTPVTVMVYSNIDDAAGNHRS